MSWILSPLSIRRLFNSSFSTFKKIVTILVSFPNIFKLHHGNYYGTSRELMSNKIKEGKIIVKDIEVNGTENILIYQV